jgi:hypothetical protein
MVILETQIITRAMLSANPKNLYLFGDNIARQGYGGYDKR